ncbi:hypothetical protein [Actinomadura sp. NPDC000600]|uniref:hypothetical protein n=1 Tax=Actinomadura sp. NPDC000600 TaxID=3154262 RepID=UPI0033914BFC
MRRRALAGMTALTLLAGGCGGSEPSIPPTAGGGPASTGTPGGPSSGGSPSGGPGAVVLNGVRPGAEKKSALDGTWTAGSGGARVRLHLYRGAAALNAPDFCTGTVNASGHIKLTCTKGTGKRTAGTAAAHANTLTVHWTSGLKDTLHRP